MKVEGAQEIHFPIDSTWNFLVDPHFIGKLIPNISAIEKLKEDVYLISGNLNVSGFSSVITGTLHIHNKKEPKSFTVDISQEGKWGVMSASIDFMLTESSLNNTMANYNVQLKLPLLVKSMIGNKIKELIHQNASAFFQRLNDQKLD
jgi:carbon monoxide dehydrogenase subunit G